VNTPMYKPQTVHVVDPADHRVTLCGRLVPCLLRVAPTLAVASLPPNRPCKRCESRYLSLAVK